MPNYAMVMMIFTLGSVGLPGTSGFVGEFLTLFASFRVDTIVAFFATTGVVLGAAYMLVLYRRMIFGPQNNADAAAMPDLTSKEKFIFLPLVLLVFYLGVQPGVVLDRTGPAVSGIVAKFESIQKPMDYNQAAITEKEKIDG